MPSRVAVIGAGAAGLVAARELRREGHDPVIFERADDVGGTWLYDPAAADNPLGAGGVHSSLYASLRINLPREIMGFLDFPFVADEGAGDPRRYPGHAEVLRYLQEFARHFDLHGLVRLRTEVVRVRRDESAGSWKVSYCSRKVAGNGSEEPEEEAFDAVVVCNGHFTEPRLADIAGIDGWPGKQLHSHNYRVPDPFRGQVVVIIGYHASGVDITRDIAGVAKEVHVAIRSAPSEVRSTCDNLWLHPTIERAEEDGTVVFQDGTRVKADAIVHCTGYKYSFPFLGDGDEAAGICVDDNRVGPLYKHVFPPQLAPHISFIALNSRSILFPLFQLQSNWVAGVLSGRIQLPSQEEMMQDVEAFYLELESHGCPKRYTHDLGGFTFEYEDWLAEQCGLEKFEEWRKLIYVVARTRVLGSWKVSYCSRKVAGNGSEEPEEEAFDAVVVCNGHFTEPRLADIAGIDGWPGKQLHSHNYRVPDPFRGQVVVIIGYHASGVDITRDIAGVAKEVHVAIRSAPCGLESTAAHANLWLHSIIERAEEDGTVVFQDGSRVKADAIVHCTGYKYSFPFLGDGDEAAGICVDDNRVGPLYKHVFPPNLAPQISFIGLNSRAILFPLFQLQSNWVAGILSGRIELPTQEAMMQDVAAFYLELESHGCPKRYTHDLGVCIFEYEDWLAEQCGMEKVEEWRRVMYAMARRRARSEESFETYRDEWDDDHLLAQAHHDFAKHL